LSTTVTVNEQFVLPQALVAVAVTVVVPTGKDVPGSWEYVMLGDGAPGAVAEKSTIAEHRPGELFTEMFAGHVMVTGLQTTATVG